MTISLRMLPIVLLMGCPSPERLIKSKDCDYQNPHALSLTFTDNEGNPYEPISVYAFASNGQSGEGEITTEGNWLVGDGAYGNIEVIVQHESGQEILQYNVLFDACNLPVQQVHEVELDVSPCPEEIYSGYTFTIQDNNGANVVADEVFYSHDGWDWIEYNCENNSCHQVQIHPVGETLYVRVARDGEAIEAQFLVMYDECGAIGEAHTLDFTGERECPGNDDILGLNRRYGCGDINLAAVNSDGTDMLTLEFETILNELELGNTLSFSATSNELELTYERGLYLDEVFCGDVMMNERYVTQSLVATAGIVHLTLNTINEALEGKVTVVLEDVVLEDSLEGCSTLIEELIWDDTLVGWFHG
ncbi:MAG: hypothetical protein VXZ96_06650 [Myxococcota bacterium]|nr:hypothetical protein [Myxococcota bacterium]